MPSKSPPPLIIVGAPRSGTNALRDALCKLPGFHTWPCDELNPLWLTRNRDVATDALEVSHARPEVASTIRNAFSRRQRAEPDSVLVEKTCANTLRLDFVHAILPEARFVEIVRDGRDAASSAVERWGAPFELGYTLRKLRFVPSADLPSVALSHLRQRIAKEGPAAASTSTWGPRWKGMTAMIERGASLEEVSAQQWLECVDSSDAFLTGTADIPVLRIRYESFVIDPTAALADVCELAEVNPPASSLQAAVADIHRASVGRWASTPLAEDEQALRVLKPALERFGYLDAC